MTSRSGEDVGGAGARASRSERIALGMLLVTLALRPCLPETVSFETPSMTRSLDVPSGPMPATTLTLSAVVFAALGLAAAARVRRGQAVVGSWVGAAGAGLLIVAAGISAWHAGQKHLAVAGAISFLGCVATLPALAMVLTTPARVRLTACVILATGAVVAGRCIYQIAFDYPDTRAYFEEHRAEYEHRAGEARGGRFYDFERRLLSDSATGYFAHSNVAASYLILVVMVGVGVALDRWRTGAVAGMVAPALVATAASIALYFCRSKGGGAALMLALGLCAAGVRWGEWISRRRRGVAVGFWVAVLASVGGVVAVGVSRGGLPSLSLLYRWQYWRGAAGIVADQGWLGIGSDNFGRWFTRFKPVECPEEVSDPHSWVVRLAVEWGVLGLFGFALMLVGASTRIARRRGGVVGESGVGEPMVAWIGVVGAAVFLSWWGIYSDGSFGFLLLLLLMPFFVWLATAGLMSVEPGFVERYRNDAARRMLPALVGGAIGFAAHTAIDLGMFAPGAACTFFAVVAMAIACGGGEQANGRPRPRLADGIMAVTGLAGLIYLIVAVRPAAMAGEQLRRARRMDGPVSWNEFVGSGQYGAYAIAASTVKSDATAIDELIPLLLRRIATVEQADEALLLIDEIRQRDPLNAAANRHAAAAYAIRSGISKQPGSLQLAVEQMRGAVAAYPTSPATRLLLAELLIRLNEMSPSAETAEAAARELEAALALDEKQVYISKPHRISDERRAAIVSEIARLRSGQPSSAATKSS